MLKADLKTNMFHSIMNFCYGKKYLTEKTINELKEFKEVLKSGDKELIIEKLSDVEIVLPYLKKFYVHGANLRIEPYPSITYDYIEIADIVLPLINLMFKTGDNKIINNMVRDSIRILCHSLGNIYDKYRIDVNEVMSWKEEKYRRELKKLVSKRKDIDADVIMSKII